MNDVYFYTSFTYFFAMPKTNPAAPAVGRRERKRQQTADHLADTAWTLFEERGYDGVTMEAIAEAADVAKGTLYKHFPVKEALLRHRFHRELADDMPAMLKSLARLRSAEAGLKSFLAKSADWSEPRRDFLSHYVHYRLLEVGAADGLAPEKRSGLEHLFTSLIAAGQKAGEFRADADAVQLAEYLQFLYLASLMRWLHRPGLDLKREFAAMLDLFLGGLRRAP